jgi:c-di-GMP-binding flagellar brake protein YcgR
MLSASQNQSSAADHDEQKARYTLHSRADILFQLRTIQKRKLLVNLDLLDSRQIVVTSVLAQLDGVSISFATGPVALCTYEKLPALRIAIPKSLVRLQRREHFRVAMPIANPVRCIVPSLSADNREPITTHIVDIGCGGVALAETSGRLGTETGRILPDCRLLLPENVTLVTSLEVRNSAQIRLHNGAFQTRLGCKFVNLPNDMAATLQRFVMDIERARRNSL